MLGGLAVARPILRDRGAATSERGAPPNRRNQAEGSGLYALPGGITGPYAASVASDVPPAPDVRAEPSLLTSEEVREAIEQSLLDGTCETGLQAERRFLMENLDRLVDLLAHLDDEAIAEHEALRLLLVHASPPPEDALW